MHHVHEKEREKDGAIVLQCTSLDHGSNVIKVIGSRFLDAVKGMSHANSPRGVWCHKHHQVLLGWPQSHSALLPMRQEQGEIIATDSQASICMIANCLDSPQTLQQYENMIMLEDVGAQLLSRAPKGKNQDSKREAPTSELRERRKLTSKPKPLEEKENVHKNTHLAIKACKASNGPRIQVGR